MSLQLEYARARTHRPPFFFLSLVLMGLFVACDCWFLVAKIADYHPRAAAAGCIITGAPAVAMLIYQFRHRRKVTL